jgi:hypothetical protein
MRQTTACHEATGAKSIMHIMMKFTTKDLIVLTNPIQYFENFLFHLALAETERE